MSCRLFNLLMLSGLTRLPLASLGFTQVQQRSMSTNAQACHVGCSICWCCPASLGFPWLHSSATACRQHKCSSVSCRLFNLLMLSGFTRLPSASLKCNMWRWLLALPELCARMQARGKSPDRSRLTRDSERLTHSRLTARRMRPLVALSNKPCVTT